MASIPGSSWKEYTTKKGLQRVHTPGNAYYEIEMQGMHNIILMEKDPQLQPRGYLSLAVTCNQASLLYKLADLENPTPLGKGQVN